MNATLAARCFRPTPVDGGVVGEETEPTNQKTLINNQHILLIMNEYQPVASLIAIQSWYGKETVFTKGEGNIQRNLLTLKAALRVLLLFWFCFLVIYHLSLSAIIFRITLLKGKTALCEGILLKEQLVFTKVLT